MRLRYYARGSGLTYIPGARAVLGQAAPYINRMHVPPKDGKPSSYPAVKEPHEVELDRETQDGASRFGRYQKHIDRGAIWPADKATADEHGVPLPDLAFADDEWIERPKHVTAPDKPKARKEPE